MYEYLYDMKKAVDFIHREGFDKNEDWISNSISLKDIGIKDVKKLTVSDLYGILEDLESLCDENVELSLSNIEGNQCTILTLKNPAHYDDEFVYDQLYLDHNVKESMNTILEACKNWTNNHKGESLQLDYKSVEQLYDVLVELDDILNINKVNN